MKAFTFLVLTSNVVIDFDPHATPDFDLTMLQVYARAGGGPVPGQPGWKFTVDHVDDGALVAVMREDEDLMLSLTGVAWSQHASDELWPELERAHLSLYEAMARAWGHTVPDNCLGNPSQPETLPWSGSIVIGYTLIQYPDVDEWLGSFQMDVTRALLEQE